MSSYDEAKIHERTMVPVTEYFLLYKLCDALNRMLLDTGVDICGGNCGGSCPLCVARARFAPTRPCVVLRTTVNKV